MAHSGASRILLATGMAIAGAGVAGHAWFGDPVVAANQPTYVLAQSTSGGTKKNTKKKPAAAQPPPEPRGSNEGPPPVPRGSNEGEPRGSFGTNDS